MTPRPDVLVIGAGSAGSVVARRLSDDPACRVVLVEPGEWPTDPDIADPGAWGRLQGRSYDWGYVTEPQPGTAGRRHAWPRGRLVGGSGAINALAHIRGHAEDFDAWAAAGGPQWSWQGLLPGFMRSERTTAGSPDLHGRDGPLDVVLPDEALSPVARAFMAAGEAIGAPRLDGHNGGRLCGVSPNELTLRDGRRVTAADAYLRPVAGRPNLSLMTATTAVSLILDGDRAIGACLRGPDGRRLDLLAGRVVLCAGSIHSPLLLMRSGIGDPDILAAAGLACRHALPGVGRNLQDHLLAAGLVWRADRLVPPSRLQHSESMMYLDSQDPRRANGPPDIVLGCGVAPIVSEVFEAPAPGTAWTILVGGTHPASRGSLRPLGPEWDAPVSIDPAYLAEPEDRAALRRGLRVARHLARQEPLAPWCGEELLPGPEVADEDDTALDAFLARAVITHHHPAGTCRMGPADDAGSVVDGSLRIVGLDGVAVVDASVIPRLPSGPINAAVIALAETWSRMAADGAV